MVLIKHIKKQSFARTSEPVKPIPLIDLVMTNRHLNALIKKEPDRRIKHLLKNIMAANTLIIRTQ